MTTVAGLLMLRNDLCLSLLKEAHAALDDAEWHCVGVYLREFAVHTELYTQAESDILFPRFAILAPDRADILLALRQEQVVITSHLKKTLDSAATRNEASCMDLLDRLVDLLSHHWSAEQPVIQTITRQEDEKLVQQLAWQLQQSTPSSAHFRSAMNRCNAPPKIH